MKLRILLSSVLVILIGAGATFQQLALKPHASSASNTTTTSTSTPGATSSTVETTTSTPHATTSHSIVPTTLSNNPLPVVNPPIVYGGPSHTRSICPLTSPYATPPATTTTVATTTTSTDPSTTSSSTSTTSSSTTTTTRPVGRFCTVLQVGDSLGYGRGHAMASRLARNHWISFYIDDRGSTGLSNQLYYNWISRIRDDLNQYHPNLLIVSFGGNDAQGISGGGQVESFGTARWQTIYASRVHQILALAAAKHCGVLWLGMPISELDYFNHEQLLINQIYSREVAASTDSVFIPLWNALSKHQRFTWTARVNGSPVTLRSQDGIHPSGWGYAVEATYVINQMKTIYHVNLELSGPAYITGY